MGIPVLIIGESGSGKSASLRNFSPDEIGIFNVASKPLPFRKKIPKLDGATYKLIEKGLSVPKLKRYAIDDSQYLLCFDMFGKAKENGYQKFTDLAVDFRNLIHNVNYALPDDVIVYFLHHTETDQNTGEIKAKTVGKMLDQYLTLEGCFDIVLYCQDHTFFTQSNNQSSAKSPEGMFELEIENNLKMVDKTIREYYGMKKGDD